MAQELERGDVYFLYRPATGQASVDGLEDVYRFYVVLKPRDGTTYRRLIVGRKKLPTDEEGDGRYWGFVDAVGDSPDAVTDAFASPEGERTARTRPAGEGVYAIVRYEAHTDFVFALDLPEEPGPVQDALNVKKEGAFVLTVKNPDTQSPAGAGLAPGEKAEFPADLQERFGSRRWVPADPPHFLDVPHAEFLLIAAPGEVPEEIGVDLQAHHASPESAGVLKDLRLDRDARELEPLVSGSWA